ncbi:hypothetical protein NNJEOMEG_03811 [Fundidesulfovibrio magnetotacticus]|uniref:PsbP C-terminal domain-containing protein n=1 Tax=Fundidesulfovibrio magnetotacticus TaxID=2730080 RepID=A0A6V8M0E7_9BACT|nr:hypothetical protein [Fundidesulfovibrio magnetotacticus]GFK95938.1 hypothetical protein NNJEOMEG_03811 [Fundidesulfovibrio magnetotacticus]
MNKRFRLSIALGVCILSLAFALPALAQFGVLQQGLDAVTKKDKAPAPAQGQGGKGFAGGVSKPLAQATTFKNTARNLEFTIPAGWEKVSGEPESDSVSFQKPGSTMGFTLHMTQMQPSFPAKASVDASLKSAKEDIKIKKLLEAKRRDDGDPKKKCGVIGWEVVEAPQTNGIQRIIWQCYDGQNFYINLMAYSSNEEFQAAQPTLRQVMDSIKFCK